MGARGDRGGVCGHPRPTSIAQFFVPGMLEAWQHTPRGLHGRVWRTCTALLVQDGGVVGTLSNLAFLLFLGVLAEQVLGRWRWLVCYLGAGWSASSQATPGSRTGRVTRWLSAGWPWRCGHSTRARRASPRCPWSGGAVCCWHRQWLWPGVILLVAASVLTRRMLTRGQLVRRAAAAVTPVVVVALVAAENLHGAALAADIVIAALVVRPARPVRRTDMGIATVAAGRGVDR